MRILYICHHTKLNGGTKALLNLLDEVAKKHDIFVLLPSDEGWLVEQLQQRKIKIYTTKYSLMWFQYKIHSFLCRDNLYKLYRFLRYKKSAEKYVLQLLKELHPDLVHSNSGTIDISLSPCLKMKIPHIWHLREYQDIDFGCKMFYGKRHFLKRIHLKGNYNVAITKDIFDYFKLRSCDRVIYDGPLDIKKIKSSQKKQDIVLFVGNLLRGKRADLAIRGFVEFYKKFPHYKMFVVGDTIDEQYTLECKGIVKRNGLSATVTFLGKRQDVYEIMSISKMLIVPSNFEGFGFITAEAMANGCLVIGRNTAGTKEQMDLGMKSCGYEIAYRFTTLDELVSKMEKAASTDTEKMRISAKNVALNNYTKEIHAQRMLAYYNEVLVDFKQRESY